MIVHPGVFLVKNPAEFVKFRVSFLTSMEERQYAALQNEKNEPDPGILTGGQFQSSIYP